MFTGIVEEMGTVRAVRRSGRSLALTVAARTVLEDLKVGDSVAFNGVCLTVVSLGTGVITADVMPETFDRTSLRHLAPGALVNLERSMLAGGRFGGHIVQGHVDGVGGVAAVQADENARRLTITAPSAVMRYVVPKGSIAVDGVSLTVVGTEADRFSVSLIPHTAAVTTLGSKQVGDLVNLEADILGKYLEHLLAARLAGDEPQAAGGGLSREFLARHGYLNEVEA